MKCSNPGISNGKTCDGTMSARPGVPSGKVECNKCGFRTDAKEEAPKKAKVKDTNLESKETE